MEDFSCSEKTAVLAKALLAVQSAALKPKRNANNPHFQSSYADLESVLDSSRDELAKNNLVLTQMPLGGIEVCRVLARLEHTETGQFYMWTFTTPVSKKDPQGICGAVTYLRRYNQNASLNMSDRDDDGNHASTNIGGAGASLTNEDGGVKYIETRTTQPPNKVYVPRAGKQISEKAQKLLFVRTKQSGFSQMEVSDHIREKWGIHSSSELDEVQLSALLKSLEDKDLHIPMGTGKDFPEDQLPF